MEPPSQPAINFHYIPRGINLILCETCMGAKYHQYPYHDVIFEHQLLLGLHTTSIRCHDCNKPLVVGEPATKCPICCLELDRQLRSLTQENFEQFMHSKEPQQISMEIRRHLYVPQDVLDTYNANRYRF